MHILKTLFFRKLYIIKMAMEQKLVEIKKTCTVNLDSVIPNEKGKFCSVCQTSVIDFTQKSTEEIASYFQTYRPEKMCGVFKSELVQTDSKLDVFISYLYFIQKQ